MMHRGLIRIAVAAGAALIAGTIATAPAAATPETQPPLGIGEAILQLPGDKPLLAKDFATKGCEGIVGGAKEGTDGWVFDQPAKGAENYAYLLGLVDAAGEKPALLWIDDKGIAAVDVTALAPAPGVARSQATAGGPKAVADAIARAKAKAQAAQSAKAKATIAEAPGRLPFDLPEAPLPQGVAGGQIATGGAWLQTPAGWQLIAGALLHDQRDSRITSFDLLHVCAPKVATVPSASASASASASPSASASASTVGGTGGGTGASLPVTGTNVGILAGIGVLLVGAGAALFAVRRRRDATKFVA
jgi:LPXTG-motif cell wall-anchored protein